MSEFELIEDAGALESLAPEWRHLAASARNAFLTPEWFWAWMEHYGERAEPRVIVARDESAGIRGIAPLVLVGSGRSRVLRFAGYNLGDEFHPLASPGGEAAIADAMGAALKAGIGSRVLLLDHVPVEDRWPGLIRAAAPGRPGMSSSPPEALPFLRIEGMSWEDFLASKSRNLRSQVRRKERALGREFKLTFRATESVDELEQDLHTLFDLHEQGWADRGGSAALTPRSREFHRSFAAAAWEQGWIRLWLLELDGEPVAAWYGWRLGDRYIFYQSGHAPRMREHSVGLVIFAHSIRAAIEEGAAEYDMLRGSEAYKLRFANGERHVHTTAIGPRWRPAFALTAAESALRRAGRHLPESLRARARGAYAGIGRRLPGGRAR